MRKRDNIECAKYRPMELVHDFNFIPCTFPQDAELPAPKERIDRIKALGYGGIVLNPSFAKTRKSHVRYGTGSELFCVCSKQNAYGRKLPIV